MKNLAAQDYEDMLQVRLFPSCITQQTHHCSLSSSHNHPTSPSVHLSLSPQASLAWAYPAATSYLATKLPSHCLSPSCLDPSHCCATPHPVLLPHCIFPCLIAALHPALSCCCTTSCSVLSPCCIFPCPIMMMCLALSHHCATSCPVPLLHCACPCYWVSVPSWCLKASLMESITNAL